MTKQEFSEVEAPARQEFSESETQESITAWGAEALGPFDRVERGVGRALEEFGELVDELCWPSTGERLRIFGKTITQSDDLIVDLDEGDKRGRVAAEMADVVIVLYRAASAAGIDLHQAIDRKMARNRARNWRRLAGGDGQHVE